jgi:hypothetical protein
MFGRATAKHSMAMVMTLACGAGCRQEARQPARQEVPPVEKTAIGTVRPADAAFGYTDDTGGHLLTLSEDNLALDAARAQAMESAICSEGRQIAIRYVRFQKRTPQDNGRQSAGNLKNDEGHLFDVVGAPADAGDTCLLVPAGYLQRFPIVRNDLSLAERQKRETGYNKARSDAEAQHQPLDVGPFNASDEVARMTIAQIAGAKNRVVRLYWPLYGAGASEQAAVVELAPAGDALLASVALAHAGRLSFFDMPASASEGETRGGCWRVDDECTFDPTSKSIPVVLGSSSEPIVVYTDWGAEGQLILLLQAQGDKLVELRRAYRYHSPV